MRAEFVVIGAGIVGCSVAHHLTELGRDDVLVLDQGPLFLAGGSTSHAPGLVFQTNTSKSMTELASYSVRHYDRLEIDGLPCWHPVGSIEVAATPERWEDLKRKRGLATSWGVTAQLLSPQEVADKIPLVDPQRIQGGFFVPSDGIAKAVRACEAMAAAAELRGARFLGDTRVTGIELSDGRVRAVRTSAGDIDAEKVVCCAGIWGPRIGRMAGVSIPLQPMQHQYALTTPLAEIAGERGEATHPILRHQDSRMYFRQVSDRYGVGSYQHRSMPVSADELRAHGEAEAMPSMMAFTEPDFEDAWIDATELLPALGRAELSEAMNGLFSFTVDGFPLLGESVRARGFWVAEAVWITHAGGVGKAIAEWMIHGAPEVDLRECDLHRFDAYAHSPAYVSARASQAFQEVYDIIHPLQPMEDPRPLRTSPFFERHRALGAFFLEGMGWERPHWFEANASLRGQGSVPERSGWEGRYWSPIVGLEHLATRERVTLFDMTPLKKLEVWGQGALGFLQWITTNDLDKPPGSITYTLMLDRLGGIKSDLTVARLSDDHFQVGCNGPLDLYWMKGLLPSDSSVQIRDITGATCCVGVWGPRSRELVQSLSDEDLSNSAFGFFRNQSIYVGEVPALAMRLSYVGELGWELYCSAELGLKLWDLLWAAGEPFGAVAGGRGAFDSLRLEKGYRAWGKDMCTEDDPFEAGLAFTIKLGKGDFVGRDALLEKSQADPSRRLSCLTLDAPGTVVMGKEPVFANGTRVGFVTSAAYGYSVGCGIAYARLPAELAAEGTPVEIEYFGENFPARVSAEPLFDPKMERMRC